MPHYLFIVARGHPEVYADLQRQFLGNPDVEVLVDRRLAERRGQRGEGSHVRGVGGDPGLPALIVELAPGTPSTAGAE